MESAKIPHYYHHPHHQQLPIQDQLLASSTSLDHAPGYAAPSAHAWTSNAILNCDGCDSSANAAIFHSRNPRLEQDILVSSLNSSVNHRDLSFNWPAYSAGNSYTNTQSSHESHLSGIKRELSNSCPNLREMISNPSSSIGDAQMERTSYRKNDPNVNLLLSTMSSGGQNINGFQSCTPEELIYGATSSSSTVLASTYKRGTFSQIYPTINVSNFSQTSLANSSSFDMNLRALDLLNFARPGADFRRSSLQDQLGASKNPHSNYRYDYVSQSIQMPSETTNITSFNHGGTLEKSSSISPEPKAPQQSAQKRPRLDQSTRPSCQQPFKVRKEKLGDRISALQQLVAPFGKTDTASVLMEAIGYIKFLQNQVETLSVPYLKSSLNKTSRAMHRAPAEGNGSEERKPDLKSRGLCLVPVSCLSYMTDTGGSVWPPPPSFGGGT